MYVQCNPSGYSVRFLCINMKGPAQRPDTENILNLGIHLHSLITLATTVQNGKGEIADVIPWFAWV